MRIRLLLIAAATTLAVGGGCGRSTEPTPPSPAPPGTVSPGTVSPGTVSPGTTSPGTTSPAAADLALPTASAPQAPPLREQWEAHYLQGTKVGYIHTAYYRDRLDGIDVVRIESTGKLTFRRFGQTLEQTLRERTWQTADGAVVRFENFMLLGDAPQVTTGVVRGATATLTLQTAGKTTMQTIDWPAGTGCSTLANDSLRARPLRPGEPRLLSSFLPVFNRVAPQTLTARSIESVDVDGVRRDLLRIEAKAEIVGQAPLESVLWSDDAGEVWKYEFPLLGQTAVRTTAARAQAADDAKPIDLGTSTLVAVDRPLVQAHATRRVRYRLELAGGDAAKSFPQSEGQAVQAEAGGAALVEVVAVRAAMPLRSGFTPTPPTDRERRASAVVQSDDEVVVRLAAEAAGSETDPVAVALGCEAFVHRSMKSVEFSQAFATAAETARSLTGDCTEHGVLLCALLRARGIPARGVVGLVYVEGRNAFGYHMWTEAWLNDRWVPLDATLGRGGASAAYLKITDSHLDGVDSYTTLMPVLGIVGKLKIAVLDQE